MNRASKVVRDPLHGNIRIKGVIAALLESPEVQRLYNIKQLGFAHLVFPGAHHTRLEHSLGSYAIASRIAETLSLKSPEYNIITCAALLHDVGHGPFSHTLESILLEKVGVNNIDLTEQLILGIQEVYTLGEKHFIQSPAVTDILDTFSIDKKQLIHCIRGIVKERPFLSQLLNSSIDVDQLDYLMRDAYYTGVAYGMIDIDRLLQTIMIYKDVLTVNRKGVSVVENILMARGLMYSSVYFHKTVRIAELMLSRAFEGVSSQEPFELFKMTDAEIMSTLQHSGDFQQEIITRLKYRTLFKQAFTRSSFELNKVQMKVIKKLENIQTRREKELEFEDTFGIPKGHIILDIPRPELLMTEPRIHRTDIGVIDKEQMRPLDDYTPIAKAIRSRITPDWIVMIITDEKYRKKVANKAEAILFS
jgi:hypothetical protein